MKVFALVDCNNFYVSCERVFNPKLKHQPVVVLSNNDGCIIARSNESKALGIAMGMPYFKIKHFCRQHHIQVYSSNYSLYGDLSQRVMDILKCHVEDVEEYSIDEAFLRFEIFRQAKDYIIIGQQLRNTIAQWVGIPVSIGFAPTKVLAKIANHVAKKQTQSNVFTLLDPQNCQRILSTFPITDIWGIGKKWSQKLNQLGIITAWELRNAPQKIIRRHFNVMMERIILELRGTPCLDLEIDEPRKEIVSSRSFAKDTSHLKDLREAISCYTARACEKLRQQNGYAGAVRVFVTSSRFDNHQHYSNAATNHFAEPTQDTRYILKRALTALEKIFLADIQYKKVGVMLLDISADKQSQVDLFAELSAADEQKSASLMKTIDTLNQRMGKNTIWLGSQGIERRWQMKRRYCSPCYTTRWDQLLKI